MNKKIIFNTLGKLLILFSILMLFPIIIALIYHENTVMSFLNTAVVSLVVGLFLSLKKVENKEIYSREGFCIVTFGWIFFSALGALPFFLSKEIPNYIDALFEAVSGFTTTGASILSDVESLSRSILFWRSFTHWLGGMGVLVFLMAVMSLTTGSSLFIIKAESPGPDVGKLVPKAKNSARILYGLYFLLTVLEIAFLKFGGLPFFDSVTLSFGTAGTGGFGLLNDSCGSYSSYIQIVLCVFMALFGINFNLYYFILIGKIKDVLRNTELKTYLLIIGISSLVISIDIRNIYSTFSECFRNSSFQVCSMLTTTGFSTQNFDTWPELSRMILVVLMFIGGCAGSTGGGLKVSRIIIMFKSVKKEIRRILHPRSVNLLTIDGKRLSEEVVHGTLVYFIVYIIILICSVLLISLDDFDIVSNVTGVISALNNIGPGLNVVGPSGNFGMYNWFSKIILIFDMLLGRLEIYPIILLFYPKMWAKRSRVKY